MPPSIDRIMPAIAGDTAAVPVVVQQKEIRIPLRLDYPRLKSIEVFSSTDQINWTQIPYEFPDDLIIREQTTNYKFYKIVYWQYE